MENIGLLPLDIVAIRHGETPGNVKSREYKNKGIDGYTEDFMKIPSVHWPLTERGLEQEGLAGEWIVRNFGADYFDRYYVSSLNRTIESAIAMNLRNAVWRIDDRLVERAHGDVEVLAPREYGEYDHVKMNLRAREVSPYFAKGPNGESFSDVVNNRITSWLGTLAREQVVSALAVAHGEWIGALQMKMEKISALDWPRIKKEDPMRSMWNGQIVHYTRTNPFTGEVSPSVSHWRTIRPWREAGRNKEIVAAAKGEDIWHERVSPTYTNDQLVELLAKRMVERSAEQPQD